MQPIFGSKGFFSAVQRAPLRRHGCELLLGVGDGGVVGGDLLPPLPVWKSGVRNFPVVPLFSDNDVEKPFDVVVALIEGACKEGGRGVGGEAHGLGESGGNGEGRGSDEGEHVVGLEWECAVGGSWTPSGTWKFAGVVVDVQRGKGGRCGAVRRHFLCCFGVGQLQVN